jgi:hypothetical protein
VAEFAAPQDFVGAEPYTISVPITETTVSFGGQGWDFFVTAGANWYRLRYANISGTITGGAGTVTIVLSAFGGAAAPSPWFGVGFEAPAQPAVAVNRSFNFTWSADIGDNYTGLADSWDVGGVMGMPLVYMPGGTTYHLRRAQSFGGDGNVQLELGIAQLEVYPHPAVGPGGDQGEQRVYLLNAARPGDAGSFG